MGIIHDGAPNAFTYGHHPSNARIVITRGLLDLLDEDEVEAVVAHEIGHAVRWDMLIMTAASLVPLIAYYVYRTLIRIRTSGRDRSAPYRYAVAIGAFVVYIISEYIVLWLSRTREYGADRFAGEATGQPNKLSSALVKIGYGLAGQAKKKPKEAEQRSSAKASARSPRLEAIGALGIFDSGAARSLAVSSTGSAGTATLDQENLKGAMRWDLWNPWARFYELNSTHPLIANRMDQLSRLAAKMGQPPLVVFDEKKPECYWDEFLVDLLVMFLPILCAAGLAVAGAVSGDERLYLLAIAGLGFGMLIKTLVSYRGGAFPEMNVAGLLKKVKVSAIRGVPCTVKGTVIGRGVPGLIWSEDFVVRDETGILFLDYRQPLRIFEFLFGLLRRGHLENEEVVATGWYRRAPVPFLELRTLVAGGKKRRCYVHPMKLILAFGLIAAGLYLGLTY
jgi:heat shock protein HtpX